MLLNNKSIIMSDLFYLFNEKIIKNLIYFSEKNLIISLGNTFPFLNDFINSSINFQTFVIPLPIKLLYSNYLLLFSQEKDLFENEFCLYTLKMYNAYFKKILEKKEKVTKEIDTIHYQLNKYFEKLQKKKKIEHFITSSNISISKETKFSCPKFYKLKINQTTLEKDNLFFLSSNLPNYRIFSKTNSFLSTNNYLYIHLPINLAKHHFINRLKKSDNF